MTTRPCACGCGWLPPAGFSAVPGHVPGPFPPVRPRRRLARRVGAVAGAVVAVVAVVTALPSAEPPTRATAADAPTAVDAPPSAVPAAPAAAAPAPVPSPVRTVAPAAPVRASEPAPQQLALLQPATGGDGDSWRDTAGQEYRLGLINTPEQGECYAAEATTERKALVAGGFRATRYSVDGYGRAVSVVTSARGVNVNVHLARHGFADDRYLDRFRHENPALAGQLDRAFAAARAEGAGRWSACGTAGEAQGIAAPPPAAAKEPAPAAGAGCHPDYATCIPVQGDGSGRGAANDLDCGQIGKTVRLRQAGVDPYRLDADGDGIGCD